MGRGIGRRPGSVDGSHAGAASSEPATARAPLPPEGPVRPLWRPALVAGALAFSGRHLFGGGLRGFLRRSQWIELLDSAAAEPAVSAQVRAGHGRTLSVAADSLPSTAMERYFTEVSQLGRHPLLTYMAFIAAAMWRAREEGNRERLDLLVSLLPVFLDQTAIEGGRAQTAYLFTGLPDPPWSRVALNTTVAWHQPYTPLAYVRWVGAQPEFLRDVDLFEQRQRAVAKPKGKGGAKDGADAKAKKEPKPKPKSKAEAKA